MTKNQNIAAPPRVALISNDRSRYNRSGLERVRRRLENQAAITHHITRSLDEASAVMAQLAADGVEILVINGGDGTAAFLFGEVIRHWPQQQRPLLLLLPGGTANMTAGDIGIRGSLPRALDKLCRWLDSGCPQDGERCQRYLMRVQPGDDCPPVHGMFMGAGVIMQGTEYAHRSVHARGLVGESSLGLSLVRTLWGMLRNDPRFYQPLPVAMHLSAAISAEPGEAAVASDRELAASETLILAVSTLERLFLGIRPFWAAGAGPLRLTAIRAGAIHFLSTFISILRNRPGRHAHAAGGYESYRAESISLWLDGSLNLDGELIEASCERGPVRISAVGPLEFLRL